MRTRWALAAAMWLVSGFTQMSEAHAFAATDGAHLHSERRIVPSPIGWVMFCHERPLECVDRADVRQRIVSLTQETYRELDEVNRAFNTAIEPVTDMDLYGVAERWTYADNAKGDCEDYVLEKRRELIARGWPISALLITVVLDKEKLGHAVLTVVTDRGDYILDNQTDMVLPWSQTGLTFIKRQDAGQPNRWTDLGGRLGLPETLTGSPRH